MIKIMLVDDNPDVADLFSEILTEAAFSVDVFTTGRAALNSCVSVRYAMVIADINMPDIDGLALLQMIRAQRPLMPYIFVSGRNAPRDENIVQNADAFVLKIDAPRDLTRKVIEVLAAKGQDAGTSQSLAAI